MKARIRFNDENFSYWLKGVQNKFPHYTVAQFCEEANLDTGQFSRLRAGKADPSKPDMIKVCTKTGYDIGVLFYIDREGGK